MSAPLLVRLSTTQSKGTFNFRVPKVINLMPAKKKKKAPWNKPPGKSRHTKLTPKSKARAKAAAKRAGRKYPSLVDNMNAAKKQRANSLKKKKR